MRATPTCCRPPATRRRCWRALSAPSSAAQVPAQVTACIHVLLTKHAATTQVCMLEEALEVRSPEQQAEVDGFREPAQYIPLYQANMPGVTHINAEAQVETGEGGEEREVRPRPAARLQSAFLLIHKATQPRLHAALVMNPIMDGRACHASRRCRL